MIVPGSLASSSSSTSQWPHDLRSTCALTGARTWSYTSARLSCQTTAMPHPAASTGRCPRRTGARGAVHRLSTGHGVRASHRPSSSMSSGTATGSGRCVRQARSTPGNRWVSRSPAPCHARWVPPRTGSWRTRPSCPCGASPAGGAPRPPSRTRRRSSTLQSTRLRCSSSSRSTGWPRAWRLPARLRNTSWMGRARMSCALVESHPGVRLRWIEGGS
mmetsp:Transcript_13303/g.36663  ORF Transcript_13303/g.36663 Transcript_13303/m.36663 type:complete len:217 (+) Transcript_13303:1081-1731(+)